jgi:hypothetical protein
VALRAPQLRMVDVTTVPGALGAGVACCALNDMLPAASNSAVPTMDLFM